MLDSSLKCRKHSCIREIYSVNNYEMDIAGANHEFELLLTAVPSYTLKGFLGDMKGYGVMRGLREIFAQLIDFINCLHTDLTREFYLQSIYLLTNDYFFCSFERL